MTLALRPYQNLIVEHGIEHPRSLVFAGMGMGKSLAALVQSNLARMLDSRPTLISAPLRVARTTWPDEARKWNFPEVVPIVGKKNERAAALKCDAAAYSINYENLPWLVEHIGRDRWPFGTIIADECTRLKGFRTRQGSSRARALAAVAHLSDRFVGLTGTPTPNGLLDLWGQMWFVDRGHRLGKSFKAFRDRWFTGDRVGASPHAIQYRPLPHAEREIRERIADVCITIDPADWFDLRDPIVTRIGVDLPNAARALYEQMEREMFADLADGIEAATAAAKTTKCLQIASGFVYDDVGETHALHDAKVQALDSVIAEANGAPVLVAYQFRADRQRLLSAFPQARLLDANPKTIEDWNAGRISILLAHPASAGHGLSLQDGGNILVYYGCGWNLEEHQQIAERIGPVRQLQSGYDRPVWVYHIVANGTVDDLVLDRLSSKRSVQDTLLNALKKRQP